MRARALAAAMTVVVVGLAVSCSSSGSPTVEAQGAASTDLVSYESDLYGLHFDHPLAWRAQEFPNVGHGSFGGPVVFLSTEALHDPCTVTSDARGQEIACGLPLDQLPDGGILATWDQVGVPGDDAAERNRVGERLTVDGYPTWFDVKTPGDCGFGADQTVSARIETDQVVSGATDETLDPQPGHWFQLTVCSRGVDHDQVISEARAMVESVTVGN
jgi:hypothetical protein